MFLKIRRTIEVLREPTEVSDPMGVGRSRVPDTAEVVTERERESGTVRPRPANPAVLVIELAILIALSIYVVSPILDLILDLQTEQGMALLTSTITGIVCFLFVTVVYELQGRLVRLVRLDFLDPFFGHRLRRTVELLRRGA